MSFDPSRLYQALLNTNLQNRDNPTYQVIRSLISALASLNTQTTSIASSSGTPGPQGPPGINSQLFIDPLDEADYMMYPPAILKKFTKGSVPFGSPSGDLAEDNADLFWDNTNKRLGIGTSASPSYTLDVTGTENISTSLICPIIYGGTLNSSQLSFVGTSGNGGSGASSAISFLVGNDGGTISFQCQNNGNVGFGGTSNPIGTRVFIAGGNGVQLDLQSSGATSLCYFTPTTGFDRWSIGVGQITTNDFGIGNTTQGTTPIQILGGSGTNQIVFNQEVAFLGTGQGQLSILKQNSLTTGIGLDVSTDALLKIRTRAQSAYGSLDALNIQSIGGYISGDVDAIGVVGAAATITVTNPNLHTLTSTAGTNMTLTPSGVGVAGQHLWICITSDAGGGDVVTFASTFKPNGTMTLTGSKKHMIEFVSDGTTWNELARTLGL